MNRRLDETLEFFLGWLTGQALLALDSVRFAENIYDRPFIVCMMTWLLMNREADRVDGFSAINYQAPYR